MFYPPMLDHPHLPGEDVQLFSDLDQGSTVVGAGPLRLGQFTADNVAWRVRIDRLSAGLLVRVRLNLDLRRRFVGERRTYLRQSFGLVEERFLLAGAAYFRLGVAQLALKRVEVFLEQADPDPQCAHFAG